MIVFCMLYKITSRYKGVRNTRSQMKHSHQPLSSLTICLFFLPSSRAHSQMNVAVANVGENRKKFYPSSLLLFSSLFFLFFLWYWVQTQGVVLARQVLYDLNQPPAVFYFSYISDRISCLCLGPVSDSHLPAPLHLVSFSLN
jgi:hypothetical protein